MNNVGFDNDGIVNGFQSFPSKYLDGDYDVMNKYSTNDLYEKYEDPIKEDCYPNIMLYKYVLTSIVDNDKKDTNKEYLNYLSSLTDYLDTVENKEEPSDEENNTTEQIVTIDNNNYTIIIPYKYKNIKYDDYINYMVKEKLFTIKNYMHHLRFVDMLVLNNLLHKTDRDECYSGIIKDIGNNRKNKVIEKSDTDETIDFSQYDYNNWKKVYDNNILEKLHKIGGSLVINKKFKFEYKLVYNDNVEIYNMRDLQYIMGSDLDEEIVIIKNKDKSDSSDKKEIVSIYDLIKIQGDKFSPFIMKEFYQEKSLWYRNTFKPTKYMKLDGEYTKNLDTINLLILNLVNHNEIRYKWVMNWLANFFQTLNKSQCALVLVGDQGSGKGIFFNEIISKLFGKEYCLQAGNSALRTNYKGGLLKDKLFINFNEISTNNNTEVKNYLKAIITDKYSTEEEKQVTMKVSVELFGQVLITSNDNFPIDIEKSDRRYNVFSTGKNIQKLDYLGYKTFNNLVSHIENELDDFARFLKSYKVDKELVNTAYDTPEKLAIINLSNDNFKIFCEAIVDMNLKYLSYLQEVDGDLFSVIEEDFTKKKMIRRKNITLYYNAIYRTNLPTKKIMDKMRKYDINNLFDINKAKGPGTNAYYKL